MDERLWQLDGVSLSTRGHARIDDVTVTISRGVTAVLGESGAGKTSLLNLLVGFDKPSTGHIGRSLALMNGHAAPLYWCPQEGGLWPHMTAREHLTAVAPRHAPDANTADDLLSRFDLDDRANARPGELSQGQRARLGVARALATRAAVIVLDEPLAHLDEARQGTFWDVIRTWTEIHHMSLVFSTHQSAQVIAFADDVICLDRGRVSYCGSVRDLYEDPPSEALARRLGEVNWLPPEHAAQWMTGPHKALACYRPHELEVTEAPDGSLVVESSRFAGPITNTRLRHDDDGRERTFVHRSNVKPPRAGMRVALRLVLGLCLALMLSACDDTNGSVLEPTGVRTWALPTEGATIPAPRAIAPAWAGEMVVLDTAGRVLIFNNEGDLLRQWWMPDYDVGKPEGACLTADGRLAVADTHYHRVVFFSRDGQVVRTLGEHGQGPGQFIYPVKLTCDDAGNLYVAEYGSNDRVQKFSPEGKWLLSFGAFGTAPGEFQRPSGVVWHDGKVYVCDATNHRVQVFSDDGKFLGILTEGETPVTLQFPYDMTLDAQGRLCLIEWGAGRLTWMTREGELIGRFGQPGSDERSMATPWGLAVTPAGRIWVADTGNRRLMEVWY